MDSTYAAISLTALTASNLWLAAFKLTTITTQLFFYCFSLHFDKIAPEIRILSAAPNAAAVC